MTIALVEPFFSGSHKRWAEEFTAKSQHDVFLLTLPGRYWKWRMHGGAVSLAEKWKDHFRSRPLPDHILTTDMIDLSTFKALAQITNIPIHLYFHENQLTYPWSETDQDISFQRDHHYGFINFTSALCADHLWFNSAYHKQSFLSALPDFLRQFPDQHLDQHIPSLAEKSKVLYLGMDLKLPDAYFLASGTANHPPIILWNHRWEYDKKPEVFFHTLFQLKEEGIPFRLVVLGASFRKWPAIFSEAREKLANEILHFGYVEDEQEYYHWLWKSDILPVTSVQDFFGGSVVEAIYCRCLPILPHRLAYPEHIPDNLQKSLLYKNIGEFLPKLRYYLTHAEEIPAISRQCRDFVKRYDWSILGPLYDSHFSYGKD